MDVRYLKGEEGQECFILKCEKCHKDTQYDRKIVSEFVLHEIGVREVVDKFSANCIMCGAQNLLTLQELVSIVKLVETEW